MPSFAQTLRKDVRAFCKALSANSLDFALSNKGKRQRKCTKALDVADIIVILLLFQDSGFRRFKWFYEDYRGRHRLHKLPSYSWFLRLRKDVLLVFLHYLAFKLGEPTGLYYIDSTALPVCHNKRISQHKTFKNQAERGKTSVDWFYGFKLHMVINHLGQIVNVYFTKGNVDDRIGLDKMAEHLQGIICGDKGYISSEREKKLAEKGLKLLTKLRKNMKAKPLSKAEQRLLKRRAIIETVNGILKEVYVLASTKTRSILGFIILMISAITAYQINAINSMHHKGFPALTRT